MIGLAVVILAIALHVAIGYVVWRINDRPATGILRREN